MDLLTHAGLHDACGTAARDYNPGVFSIPPTRGAAAMVAHVMVW
jgi:hypothetical protein